MEQKRLIINNGSASKKYAIYSGGEELFRGHLEYEDEGKSATFTFGSEEFKEKISEDQYQSALDYFLDVALSRKIITEISDISLIGLRVVAPGSYFSSNRIVDENYLEKLAAAKEEDPLHIGAVISELEQIKKYLPRVKIIAVSDSAFHSTISDFIRRYSLPADISEKFDIYRFGYHGISAQSILRKLREDGQTPTKLIICHLGGGVSITAIKNGSSFDTSMGFSPLEGAIMATRIGNIDSSAVLQLVKKMKVSPDDIENFLSDKCGLLGLSGRSSDVRELLEFEKQGDKAARLALDAFAYKVRKYIGSYAAALGGLDLLVFTGTIGQRSPVMRERICRGLDALGLILDEARNNQVVSSGGSIQSAASPVKIAVIRNNEMAEINSQLE